MAPFKYSAFGLTISSDFECQELRSGTGPFDVRFRFGDVPLAGDFATENVLSQVGAGKYLLKISGVARYLVTAGNDIAVDPSPLADVGAVHLFLLGSAMGALLHQRRVLPLHASAVSTPYGAVVFAGPSGSGKSTLAAALCRRGFGILADDVCAIDGSGVPAVMPGTTSLKVWADALRQLNIADRDLRPVRAGLKKYFLSSLHGLSADPVSLHSVYILEVSNSDRAVISPVPGLTKFQALIANTFRKSLVEPMGLMESYFEQIGKVAASARVRRVLRPRDGFRIDELVDLLIGDFAK